MVAWSPSLSAAARGLPRVPSQLCLDRLVDDRHDIAEPTDSRDVDGSQRNAAEILHHPVRIRAVLEQELHDAGVAFADGVMQGREWTARNLARQQRRLTQQLAHRRFIAAGAGGNHTGAIGIRVGHSCGPVTIPAGGGG